MKPANDNLPTGSMVACGLVFTAKQFNDGLGVAAHHVCDADITAAFRSDEDLATFHVCMLSDADQYDPSVLATGVAGLKRLASGGAR